MTTGKALTDERQASGHAFVRKLIDKEFEGNVTRAARAMGMAQSTLNDLLLEKRGAGLTLLEQLADFAGCSIDHILGRALLGGEPRTEQL